MAPRFFLQVLALGYYVSNIFSLILAYSEIDEHYSEQYDHLFNFKMIMMFLSQYDLERLTFLNAFQSSRLISFSADALA